MSNEDKLSTPPPPRSLTTSDKLIDVIGDKLLANQPKVPFDKRLAKLTDEEKSKLQEIEDRAIIYFSGQFDELEAALGMLRMGHHVGWKVLYIIHSKKTVRKYEEILDIKIRDIFPEKGPSSYRSVGLGFAEKFSNFWKVVSGDIKITNRKDIE